MFSSESEDNKNHQSPTVDRWPLTTDFADHPPPTSQTTDFADNRPPTTDHPPPRDAGDPPPSSPLSNASDPPPRDADPCDVHPGNHRR